MTHANSIPTHRTMRLHEWLTLLALMFLCAGVRAESVFKCTATDGAIAYQASPCAATQLARTIEIAPAPAFSPSPRYAVGTLESRRMIASVRQPHSESRKAEMAFECHGSGGEVFYRLGRCPHSVAAETDKQHGNSSHTKPVSVSGHAVPRSQACAEMRRAGSIGRKGHEFDESISTYDRNVGNDPCK